MTWRVYASFKKEVINKFTDIKNMSIKELLNQKDKSQIIYSDLLMTDEWKEYRLKILSSDDYYCTKCGLSATTWHNGSLTTFDKSKLMDVEFQGKRIIADFPVLSDKNIYLHVHHKYYIMGRLPWEYKKEVLTTLCNWCHWDLHQNHIIKIYQDSISGLLELRLTPCERCYGAGVFPEYSHVHSGICFKCKGTRYEEFIGKSESYWF